MGFSHVTAVTTMLPLAGILVGCAGTSPVPDSGTAFSIPPSAIEAHVRFLADDGMEGREAGTRGYDLAANYVATQFQLMGLQPAGSEGGYFQPVPLQAHWLVPDGAGLEVRHDDGRTVSLTLSEDFIVGSSAASTTSEISGRAVFVGYGVTAPEFDHDDYAGLDVDGKVAIVLAGYPAELPSEEGAHYGSAREKVQAAAAGGAVAIVTVYTDAYEAVAPWARVSANTGGMSMTWIGPDNRPFSAAQGIRASALMSPEAGARLFDGAERSYAEIRASLADGPPSGFPLAVSLDIATSSRHELRTSANVVGLVEGSDPILRNEYVVMLGHLDHNGIGQPVDGDAIYNGALDNASGIAVLLEAARVMASQPVAPRRSVLFLAVTAEEKGLLGSEFFARNPTVSAENIIAAVNVDMPVLLYDFTDVIAFGAEHSSLQDVLTSTLEDMDLTLTPDPMPEQAIFTRSDHYRFVQQGIPSLLLATGWNTPEGDGEGGKLFQGFLGGNYHRPADDLDQPIDYVAGALFAQVNYQLLDAIANDDLAPSWNEGDFFGTVFADAR